MKNKKGFTLVELIGVVILIGLIALIAIPSVDYIIKKTKDNAYERTKDTLEDGLRNWVTDNKELIYEDGEEIIVTLADLKEQGYIEYEIKNPKTRTCLANTMQFKITRVKDTEKDTYEYTFLDEELLDGNLKDCEAVSKTPSIYLLGDNPQKIEITNDSTLTYALFDPGATAKSSAGEDISSSIVKSNNVNLKVLGKDYHAKYTIIENGISKTLTRKVYVVDTTSPELHVPEDLEIEIGETLNLMEGVTATDNSGEAPTIKTSGSVNFNKEGEYKVIYIATDKSGNSIQKERIVKVSKKYYTLRKYAQSSTLDFHSGSYKSKIITINFVYGINIPENAIKTWDLSEARDGKIKGWLIEMSENPGYYNMYIGSSGGIRANQDSSWWFAGLTSLYSIYFENYDTVNVQNMSYLFYGDQELSILDGLDNFDTSSVTNMASMFATINASELDLVNFDTSNVIDMNNMFRSNDNLLNLNLNSFNTSQVTNMSDMFSYLSSIQEIIIDNFDTSRVVDMSWMFYNSAVLNLDVSNFDTSQVVDMSWMFGSLDNLTSLDLSNFNTSQVTNMSSMFSWSSKINELDISSFDTSNVTSMSSMFQNVQSLESIKIQHFDTSQVTNMNYMFAFTYSLKELDVSNFDTSNVTNMSYMFDHTGISQIDITNWNTQNVTKMANMFACNTSGVEVCELKKIIGFENLNTSNVTTMSSMFSDSNIEELDFTNFDTSKVTDMSGMFVRTNFTTLDLSSFDTNNVTSMSLMFYGSSKLKTIYIGKNWKINDGVDTLSMFYSCGTSNLTLKET